MYAPAKAKVNVGLGPECSCPDQYQQQDRPYGIDGRGVGDGHFSSGTFICYLLGAPHIFLGQAWVEGKGELVTCRHCTDSGQETVS